MLSHAVEFEICRCKFCHMLDGIVEVSLNSCDHLCQAIVTTSLNSCRHSCLGAHTSAAGHGQKQAPGLSSTKLLPSCMCGRKRVSTTPELMMPWVQMVGSVRKRVNSCAGIHAGRIRCVFGAGTFKLAPHTAAW